MDSNSSNTPPQTTTDTSQSDECSCDDNGEGGTANLSNLNLTLENFDSDDVTPDCPYVLTSPRSLEACKLVGVRVRLRDCSFLKSFFIAKFSTIHFFQPVDLLPFRLEDARRELDSNGDFSIEALTIIRNAEEERRGKNPIW